MSFQINTNNYTRFVCPDCMPDLCPVRHSARVWKRYICNQEPLSMYHSHSRIYHYLVAKQVCFSKTILAISFVNNLAQSPSLCPPVSFPHCQPFEVDTQYRLITKQHTQRDGSEDSFCTWTEYNIWKTGPTWSTIIVLFLLLFFTCLSTAYWVMKAWCLPGTSTSGSDDSWSIPGKIIKPRSIGCSG